MMAKSGTAAQESTWYCIQQNNLYMTEIPLHTTCTPVPWKLRYNIVPQKCWGQQKKATNHVVKTHTPSANVLPNIACCFDIFILFVYNYKHSQFDAGQFSLWHLKQWLSPHCCGNYSPWMFPLCPVLTALPSLLHLVPLFRQRSNHQSHITVQEVTNAHCLSACVKPTAVMATKDVDEDCQDTLMHLCLMYCYTDSAQKHKKKQQTNLFA